MVTPELVAQLKQVNVSKDKEKSSERVKEAFSAASRKAKQEIEKLTGQKRTAIYRAAKTGSVSAKILLPMSEILNISPFWFTAESDDKDPCNDTLILKFLNERGYKFSPKKYARAAKPAEPKAARAPRKTEIAAGAPSAEQDDEITVTVTLNNTQQMRDAVASLDADSAGYLLHALCLRAKVSGNAEQLWEVVKICLLS